MRRATIITLFALFAFHQKDPTVDKQQAKEAFCFLNQVRTTPKRFVKEMPFLVQAGRMAALQWNDTLAAVAERKALDMANRNYFAHVDPEGYGINYYIHKEGYILPESWLKNPKANFFESCNGGGPTGQEAIKMLLIDKDVPSLGHRKHLLGIDAWSASLVDIGIGFANAGEGRQYKTYTCIIIAKHEQ
jgi:uncharacterized protein YkwD